MAKMYLKTMSVEEYHDDYLMLHVNLVSELGDEPAQYFDQIIVEKRIPRHELGLALKLLGERLMRTIG